MKEEFETKVSNYYGTVIFRKEKDKYYMALENYDCESYQEITEKLYEEAKKVFLKANI